MQLAARHRFARGVTDSFAPGVIAGVLVLFIGVKCDGLSGAAWGMIGAFFCSVAPLTYIGIGIKRGRFTDFHVTVRTHRAPVLAVSLGSVAVGLALLIGLGAPRDVVALFPAMLAALVIGAVVTHWWKISMHATVAAGATMILAVVFGVVALLLWLVVAIICWSRVNLGDHTVAQALAGSALGGLVVPAMFLLGTR